MMALALFGLPALLAFALGLYVARGDDPHTRASVAIGFAMTFPISLTIMCGIGATNVVARCIELVEGRR